MKIKHIITIFAVTVGLGACDSEIPSASKTMDDLPDLSLSEYVPTFEHPGILHNKKSIARMREIVTEANPSSAAYQTYLLLKEDPAAQAGYEMKGPFEYIARQGDYQHTKNLFESDFKAAYLNALMYVVTGEDTHARKSIEILTGYAGTLKGIAPHNDAWLLAGIETAKLAFALDMLTSMSDLMTQSQIDSVNSMLRNVFLAKLDDFMDADPSTNGNWGLSVAHSRLALSILWNDLEMYQSTCKFLLSGYDNGTLYYYIDAATGQCQESGRDQGHVQLGLAFAVASCEMAYKQGNDLYGALDNRLLLGMEYTARYNSGHDDVPFKTWKDVTGKYCNWTSISSESRGQYWSIYGAAYNHYVGRKGLAMPFTKELLDRNNWLGKADNVGLDYDIFQFNDRDL